MENTHEIRPNMMCINLARQCLLFSRRHRILKELTKLNSPQIQETKEALNTDYKEWEENLNAQGIYLTNMKNKKSK